LGFPGALAVKNSPANAGDIRDVDSIPGSGRSPLRTKAFIAPAAGRAGS